MPNHILNSENCRIRVVSYPNPHSCFLGRHALWNLFRTINQCGVHILVGCSDFNISRFVEDQNGRGSGLTRGMFEFNDLIRELECIDLLFFGCWFTWSNFRHKPNLGKIDRFFF